MMLPVSDEGAIRRWFGALVEEKFQREIGLADPALIDYLAGLLTEFIHVERIHYLHDGSGRRIEDVANMLAETVWEPGLDPDDRHRLVHRHIGDYTLFWTGVYPENLRRLRRRLSRDGLIDYFEQGKRSYAIASDLSNEDTDPPASLLSDLSTNFEFCAYGLGLVRQGWEQRNPADSDSCTDLLT